MKTYKNWSPTEYDRRGLGLPDRGEWLVLPVILTRDSGPFEQSNFTAAMAMLGGESETLERHEFNHWACGWFAILLLDPSRVAEGEALEERLERYPVLNEDDLYERERAEYDLSWSQYGEREFACQLQKEFGLSDTATDALEGEPVREYYESLIPSGEYYVPEDSGVRLQITYAANRATRDGVAALLRACRRGALR